MLVDNKIYSNNNYTTVAATVAATAAATAIAPLRPVSVGRMDVLQIIHHHRSNVALCFFINRIVYYPTKYGIKNDKGPRGALCNERISEEKKNE